MEDANISAEDSGTVDAQRRVPSTSTKKVMTVTACESHTHRQCRENDQKNAATSSRKTTKRLSSRKKRKRVGRNDCCSVGTVPVLDL